MTKGRVLVVDDDRAMIETVARALERRGYEVVARTNAAEALVLLSVQSFDVVLTDLRMEGTDGIELCQRIRGVAPDLPTIVFTAFGSTESAIAAIRAGAYDYVIKPFEIEDLALRLQRAVKHRQLSEEVKRLRVAVERPSQVGELIGESPAMQRLQELILRVAESEASVLIVGETGTGKELVARAIHDHGRRAKGPFVALNCAALPETLLESELFGHVQGAFTDARRDRSGLMVQAGGGVLFLDEIGDMPLTLQPKLLRAIQERRVRPIGGSDEIPIDVQVIAATHQDLEAAVEDKRFREDLYYRINVIQIEVSPLRARGNDVLLLAQRFLDEFAQRSGKKVTGLTEGAAERLLGYTWPGNVRELRNCIERAVALTRYERITVDDLPDKVRQEQTNTVITGEDPASFSSMADMEQRYIRRVLAAVGGNKAEAARILGLDRTTLYRKLKRKQDKAEEV